MSFLVLYCAWIQRSLVLHCATHVWAQDLPGNDALLHVWALAWGQHALATQPGHVFDANIFFPYPGTLLYSDHLLGLALLLSPLRLFTDNYILVHNLAHLGASILNPLVMYLLAFELTGNIGAAVIGAVIYGFAPMRFDADRHQIQTLVAWWLPLMLWCGRRALATGQWRYAVGVGVAWTLQALTGIYLTAFFAPFWALALLWWSFRYPPSTHARGWMALLTMQALAVLLIAPSLLAYRAVQSGLGVARSVVLNALLCLHVQNLPEYVPVVTLAVLAVGLWLAHRRAPELFRSELGLYVMIALGALLLAFGPTLPMPFDHGWMRGPYALLLKLPGYDALRAPGRMLHIALIGAAVLGAGAVAALTAGRGPVVTVGLTVIVAASALFEGLPPKLQMIWVPGAETDPTVAWLAKQPASWRLVELPMETGSTFEQIFQFRSTGHWKPMINGSMGISPPLHGYLVGRLEAGFDRSIGAELRALGVTHVVSHTPWLSAPQRDAINRGLTGSRPPLKLVRSFPDTTRVLALRPRLALAPTVVPGVPIPRDDWQVTASVDVRHMRQSIDDDPRSAWRSWGDLEHYLDRWHDRIPFMIRWAQFIRKQPGQLRIELPRPTPLSAVVARLAGSDSAALAGIVVETSVDGKLWTPVPGHFRPLPEVRALLLDAPNAWMAVVPPKPILAKHVRLGVVGYEWQVADLTLLRATTPPPAAAPTSRSRRPAPPASRPKTPVAPGKRSLPLRTAAQKICLRGACVGQTAANR